MADPLARVRLNYLLDFYGPLLTENRRELLRLYLEEDMSFGEIGERFAISRQAVADAVHKAADKLEKYETELKLVDRYLRISELAEAGLGALSGLHVSADEAADLKRAEDAFHTILKLER